MNFYLHGLNGRVISNNALTDDALSLKPADLILANPPFGSMGGDARARREDLAITTSNKQLLFLQHIYRSLKPGGRVAVVVPDNFLFETDAGRRVRQELFETCDVHTILRLPVGIFYATGVSNVVLMFTRRAPTDQPAEDRLWVYDLRGTAKRYGRGIPFDAASLSGFKAFYGDYPLGRAPRQESGPAFNSWSLEDVVARNYDLDLVRDPVGDALDADVKDFASLNAEQLREALSEAESLGLDLASLRSPVNPVVS